MSDVDQIISIRKILSNIWEADEMPAAPPSDEPAAEPAEQPAIDQPELDRDVDDVMTTPRTASPDDEAIATVADDLGVEDTTAFVKAFDAMRSGASTSEVDSTVLASAFERLMSADTSTVQKTINRLRDIYDRPVGAQSTSD